MKERERKESSSAFLFGVVVTIVGILIVALSNTLLKDWTIISFGVRSFRLVQKILYGITLFGALFTLLASIPLIKNAVLNKLSREVKVAQERNRSQVLANYAEDSANPIFTRKRFEQLRQDSPDFEDLIEQCIGQMDLMDALQEKQSDLIKANDALYLKDTVPVLDNVERRICQNFRNIMNLCIAAGSFRQLNMEKVNKSLTDNEHKLNDTKELLAASVDWINQCNASSSGDRSEVENWIKVIRSSLEED